MCEKNIYKDILGQSSDLKAAKVWLTNRTFALTSDGDKTLVFKVSIEIQKLKQLLTNS